MPQRGDHHRVLVDIALDQDRLAGRAQAPVFHQQGDQVICHRFHHHLAEETIIQDQRPGQAEIECAILTALDRVNP